MNKRTERVYGLPMLVLLAAMARGQLGERLRRNLVGVGDRDASGGEGAQRRGPLASLQQRALPQDRTRPNLGEGFSVDVHGEHPVEQEEQFVAGLTLLDESLTGLELPHLGLRAAA